MELANAAEMELLQVKVDAAKSRLKNAQVTLRSVLNLLSDLPAALKTGVMRIIETAFEDLEEAEKHVLELKAVVPSSRVAASTVCAHEAPSALDVVSSS
ncbi:MAG TPA: hypothetical protein VFK05_07050 [Polyangiaceae bacterium]|nr:hypothetical protein [Polyangiaceae bacterium]